MSTIIRILHLGMPASTHPLESRRILLLNMFYLLCTLSIIACLAESIAASEPLAIQLTHIGTLVLLTSIPFIARRDSYSAAAFLLFIVNGIVFFFCNIQGLESGTFLFYFPLFFANGWLMDFRKPLYSVLVLGMTMVGAILVALIPEPIFGITITPAQVEASFVFNLVTSAVVMGVNTVVIVWMNYTRQIELEQEIAEKEKASHSLAVTLKEKEVLIAEIHHRVKNNLAVVRGLLNLQMNATTNEAAKETLRESVNRVTAMALIHQKLYSNRNADAIDLKKYVAELVREVATSYQLDGNAVPKVNVHVENTSLDLNRAVPCGLILNELLTNAFKHAFNGNTNPEIDIHIAPAPERSSFIQLVVSDNGKGIPADFHPETSDSLGITIIRSLSEQLDGTFTFQGGPQKGTRATVIFPSSNAKKTAKTVS